MNTLSASRELKKLVGDGWRDAMINVRDNEEDFEVENYRFVQDAVIDEILAEELANDPYILGCFNAWFLTDHCDLSHDIITALQNGDEYEALGQHLIDNDKVAGIAKAYAGADGYGHHFNHWDGSEEEFMLPNADGASVHYRAFRTN